MAEYTIELRSLVQRHFPLALNDYPIFNEDYRPLLNDKIIQHFWYREIGQETPDRFNRFLRRKMNEIMPYYNELYKTQLIEFDPLATEMIMGVTSTTDKSKQKSDVGYSAKTSESTGDVFTSNRDLTQKTGLEGTQDYTSTANYTKQGDRVVDVTMERTENLNEDKTANTETTRDLTRNTGVIRHDDELTKKIYEDNVTDKTDTTANEQYDEGANTTGNKNHTNNITDVGSKDSKFSDIPQAMNVEEVEGDDGQTIEVDGYLTTRTVDNTSNNRTDIGNETWTENVNTDHTKDNTSTTDYTSNKEGNSTTDRDYDLKSDEILTEKETTNQDYTHNVKNDNVINQTENTKELWHESGESAQADNTKVVQNTSLGENEKNDSERNIARSEDNTSKRKESIHTDRESELTTQSKGRRGSSPAKLIQDYRAILINIDMMIIDELEPLFMQVW